MKLVLVIALSVLTAVTKFDCGGGPGDGSETVLSLSCEYDYSPDCNIFPSNNYTYVGAAFDDANINFSAYFDDNLGAQYPQNEADLYAIAEQYAQKESDGSYVYELYLVSVNTYSNSSTLGGTLGDGQSHHALCAIFYDNIRSFASSNNPPLDQAVLRQGTVIHELGHGRGRLTHLCENTAAHNSPWEGGTCIMADNFPRPSCLEPTDKGPLDLIGFCGKCIDTLKQVSW